MHFMLYGLWSSLSSFLDGTTRILKSLKQLLTLKKHTAWMASFFIFNNRKKSFQN